mgnify:CR=1 FL=1
MAMNNLGIVRRNIARADRAAVDKLSKYGVANRAFRALRDLFAVRWMRSRIRRLPIVVEESDVAGR